MRSFVLIALFGLSIATVYGKTWIEFQPADKVPEGTDGKDGVQAGGIGGVAIHTRVKNKNLNDINIGGKCSKEKRREAEEASHQDKGDSEDFRINWSGERRDRSYDDRKERDDETSEEKGGKKWKKNKWWWKWGKHDNNNNNGDTNGDGIPDVPVDNNGDGIPDVPTDTNNNGIPDAQEVTTLAPTTTTLSPNCTCTFNKRTNATYTYMDSCTFPSEDVQAHCDQWGYSLCRAVCTAAATINYEACTPIDGYAYVNSIFCTCPSLRFAGRAFSVPDTDKGKSSFFGDRYKSCWKQCKTQYDRSYSGDTDNWDNTNNNDNWDDNNWSRGGRGGRGGRGRGSHGYDDENWTGETGNANNNEDESK